MNRDEFMRQVEYLLSDIPEEDKRDAIDYYRDYLEEAGNKEQEVIREFGSPERIAAIIRSDIGGYLENGGEFTDAGYTDERFRDPSYQITGRPAGKPEGGVSGNNSHMTFFKAVVIIAAVLVLLPLILGIGGSALGAIAAVVCVLAGIIILAAAVTFILLLLAFGIGIYGIIMLFSNVPGGMLCIGIGLVILSLGLLSFCAAALFYVRFLPWLFRGCVNAVSRLFHRS